MIDLDTLKQTSIANVKDGQIFYGYYIHYPDGNIQYVSITHRQRLDAKLGKFFRDEDGLTAVKEVGGIDLNYGYYIRYRIADVLVEK